MTTALSPLDAAKKDLYAMDGDFKAALPSHITPEKFRNVAITALTNNPDLLNANRQTLWNSIIKCAQDGLLPDGREAALVKFKDEVTYMPMVQGILKKVRNSGELSSINAQNVYMNDTYDSWVDEKGSHFTHRKAQGDRGQPRLTYAYAIMKDGATYFEEISEEDMLKIAKIAKTDKIWGGPFREEMKRKSAIHRLSKRLPMNTDLQAVIDRENEFYDVDQEPEVKKQTTNSKLTDTVVSQTPIEVVAEPQTKAEPSPPPADAVQTTIYDLMFKQSKPEDKKQWKMCGIKINDVMYSTFDNNITEKLKEAKENHTLVNVHFKDEVKGDKTYKMITEISYPTVASVQAVHDPRCTCKDCMPGSSPV